MKVTVIGTGYVGLVTGTCLADQGHQVMCIDNQIDKIENLKKGQIPIYEPGLSQLVKKNIEAGRLSFSSHIHEGVQFATLQIIAVGTPQGEDGSADLNYLLSAAEQIAVHMNDYKIIINKSTVPIGTAQKVKSQINKILLSQQKNLTFDVVSNPEFLKEGAAINDFQRPDRIILGVDSDRPLELLKQLYEPFQRNHDKLMIMNFESSELTKYASNAMLATRISFMNELSQLCDQTGAKIEMVRKGIGADKRIGFDFLYAGLGYGGSCFPKDIKALIKTGSQYGIELKIIKSVEEANRHQKEKFVQKIINYFNTQSQLDKVITLWGLAFKPNTDDMREAPSLYIINRLFHLGFKFHLYDPIANKETKIALQSILSEEQIKMSVRFFESQYEALINSNSLILVTEWNDFKHPDFEIVKKNLNHAVIFDGRNIYSRTQIERLNIKYFGQGM